MEDKRVYSYEELAPLLSADKSTIILCTTNACSGQQIYFRTDNFPLHRPMIRKRKREFTILQDDCDSDYGK